MSDVVPSNSISSAASAVPSDSRVEQYIWKYVGRKSARQIAEELGVTPDTVLRVKREIVESVDELTVQVQRAKLIATLQELADEAQQRAHDIGDERNYAGVINASVGAIKAVLVELNRVSARESEAVAELNRLRVRELLRLIDATVDLTFREVSDRFGVDYEELHSIFGGYLRPAADGLDI